MSSYEYRSGAAEGGEQVSDSYVGHREQINDRRLSRCQAWRPDGEPPPLEPSLLVVSHSPTGFEWGYLGSGPAQLALALLLDHTDDAAMAARWHQQFKAAVVSRWRGDTWEIAPAEIAVWLAAREGDSK